MILSHQTDFRVEFLKDNPFPMGTKKSKAVGEPCVCLPACLPACLPVVRTYVR